MAISNHDRISRALEVFNLGLAPFVEREMQTHIGDEWHTRVRENLNDRLFDMNAQANLLQWDTSALIGTILDICRAPALPRRRSRCQLAAEYARRLKRRAVLSARPDKFSPRESLRP